MLVGPWASKHTTTRHVSGKLTGSGRADELERRGLNRCRNRCPRDQPMQVDELCVDSSRTRHMCWDELARRSDAIRSNRCQLDKRAACPGRSEITEVPGFLGDPAWRDTPLCRAFNRVRTSSSERPIRNESGRCLLCHSSHPRG